MSEEELIASTARQLDTIIKIMAHKHIFLELAL